jgi:hypothetical protein
MFRMLRLTTSVAVLATLLNSCEDNAGQGGDARIVGKVYASKYNASFTYKFGSYYEPDQKVFLVYDDDLTASDNTDTNFDGTYEFKYLRKGTYRIYVYSKDSTGAYQLKADPNAPKIPVQRKVEIKERKQTVTVPDIEIIK